MPDLEADAVARQFGPYVLLDHIGSGGMAEIYLAKRKGQYGFEKLVALKRILPRYTQNELFRKMLIQEAKLAAALQHLNVVQVMDLGEIDEQVYIAMEHVHGRDLAKLLSVNFKRGEQIPVALSLFLLTEFLSGLEYAHRLQDHAGRPLGLIHRDISPQNILLSFEGEVKVTDFGIARVLMPGEGSNLPGNLHGKVGYMPPEQVHRQPLDQRADIFSAGVVIHETLTGQRLFRTKDLQKAAELILNMPIPAPSELNPQTPREVDRICAKALARDPDDRYQTVGALLGDLSRAADDLRRRAARRDLSVYMRRVFGTLAGRETAPKSRVPTNEVNRVSPFSPTPTNRVPIGRILVDRGAIDLDQLELALAQQRARGGRIGEVLIGMGALREVDLAEGLGVQAQVPAVTEAELLAQDPPWVLLERYPKDVAENALIVPMGLADGGRTVILAVADPFDSRAVLETKVVLGVREISVRVATRTAIRAATARWYDEIQRRLRMTIPAPAVAELVPDRKVFDDGGFAGQPTIATPPPEPSRDLPAVSSEVSGRIEEMGPVELVQSLEQSQGTAVIHIVAEDQRSGDIGVVEGNVRFCRTGDAIGEDAFFALCGISEGTFRIEYRPIAGASNVSLPNTLLILEALAQVEALSEGNTPFFGMTGFPPEPPRAIESTTPAKAKSEPPPKPERPPEQNPEPPPGPKAEAPKKRRRGNKSSRPVGTAFPDDLIDEVLGD